LPNQAYYSKNQWNQQQQAIGDRREFNAKTGGELFYIAFCKKQSRQFAPAGRTPFAVIITLTMHKI
jgi:hypothetical protein